MLDDLRRHHRIERPEGLDLLADGIRRAAVELGHRVLVHVDDARLALAVAVGLRGAEGLEVAELHRLEVGLLDPLPVDVDAHDLDAVLGVVERRQAVADTDIEDALHPGILKPT